MKIYGKDFKESEIYKYYQKQFLKRVLEIIDKLPWDYYLATKVISKDLVKAKIKEEFKK